MRPTVSPRWLFAGKAALAAIAVAGLVRLAHPADVRAAWAAVDGRWLAAALALMPLNVALDAVRWGRLVQRVAPGVRMRDAVAAVVGSYPLGLLTPARVGDLVGRAALLPGVPRGASAALTLGERMATLWCCLVGGALALTVNPAAESAPAALWTTVGVWAVVAAVGLGAAIASPGLTGRVLARVVPVGVVRRAVGAFERIPRREAAVLIALSALRYAVFSTQFALLVRAFAPEAAWLPVAAGVAVVYLLKSAVPQVTLGDLGVREGVAVFVLAGAGVPAAAALNASLAVFVINLVLPAAAGIPLLVRLRPASRAAARTAAARTAVDRTAAHAAADRAPSAPEAAARDMAGSAA